MTTPLSPEEAEAEAQKKIILFEQKWKEMQKDVEKGPKPRTTRKIVRGTEPTKTNVDTEQITGPKFVLSPPSVPKPAGSVSPNMGKRESEMGDEKHKKDPGFISNYDNWDLGPVPSYMSPQGDRVHDPDAGVTLWDNVELEFSPPTPPQNRPAALRLGNEKEE